MSAVNMSPAFQAMGTQPAICGLMHNMPGPVTAGCRIGPFLERMSEVTGIAEADALCDLIHAQIGFTQKFNSQVLPGFIQNLLI